MTPETKTKLQNWTRSFAQSGQGAWLNDFNWQDIPVDWSKHCNADNGIMGAYAFGQIRLMDCEFMPELIWSTYVHELFHRWQWLKNPVKYIIGKLYRPLIEDPADRMTEEAERFLETAKGEK